MHSRFRADPARRHRLPRAALVACGICVCCAATAQADGDQGAPPVWLSAPVPQTTAQQARIAAVDAPGGALMNQLDARMRQIQATQDPVLRQRRMEEFLKTLQGGMEKIGKVGPTVSR